jgi:hypothetical protein
MTSREPDITKQSQFLHDLKRTRHHKAESVSSCLRRTRRHKVESVSSWPQENQTPQSRVSFFITSREPGNTKQSQFLYDLKRTRHHKSKFSTYMTSREPDTTKQRSIPVRPIGNQAPSSRSHYLCNQKPVTTTQWSVPKLPLGIQALQSRSHYLCDHRTRHHKAEYSTCMTSREPETTKQRYPCDQRTIHHKAQASTVYDIKRTCH